MSTIGVNEDDLVVSGSDVSAVDDEAIFHHLVSDPGSIDRLLKVSQLTGLRCTGRIEEASLLCARLFVVDVVVQHFTVDTSKRFSIISTSDN
ncbi:hypothetical protein LSH36_242g08051 [Paralvinella palmiformis]|uniref:Uncharacterized protein n=1 Tax=Paralvinella palmiformis TaxID=53620 RepID=A0AAD9JNP6_9ANNE|nr:hypothetical protein LSH36_242g08051 [Paralvinella palmiformis]